MIDLECQSKEIAKAIVEAQKVGIDCLDADDAFAILPDISKELKVHKGRSASVQHTLTTVSFSIFGRLLLILGH